MTLIAWPQGSGVAWSAPADHAHGSIAAAVHHAYEAARAGDAAAVDALRRAVVRAWAARSVRTTAPGETP